MASSRQTIASCLREAGDDEKGLEELRYIHPGLLADIIQGKGDRRL
jgi:hypothetical protein